MERKLAKPIWILCLLAFVLLSVCACSGDSYSHRVFKERERLAEIKRMLKPGMTKAEVLSVAGAPNFEQKFSEQDEALFYQTDVVEGDRGKDVLTGFTVEMVSGKVFAIKDAVSSVR